MSKQNEVSVPVNKHLDQITVMLEDAELDYEEGFSEGGRSYIEIKGVRLYFGSESELVNVEVI